MSQSAPGFAPSPSARPDREAEFLKALGRRDADTCLQLLQHLVHRRGVGALEGLRRHSLALETQQRDWIWLDQLLVDQPIPAAAPQWSRQQSSSHPDPGSVRVVVPAPASLELAVAGPAEAAAEPVTTMAAAVVAAPALAPDPGLETQRPASQGSPVGDGSGAVVASADALGLPEQGREFVASLLSREPEPLALLQEQARKSELDLLAKGAVDAAFEALAAEFPSYGPATAPLQLSQPTSSQDWIDPWDQIQPSEPAQLPVAETPEPPVVVFGEASLLPVRESQPKRMFSFVIPRPLDPSPLGGESEPASPSGGDLARVDQALAAEPNGDPAQRGQGAGLWGRAEGRMAGLGDRLRGRFSLTRVKALVRDCVEEAVASLQGQNPGVELQPQVALAPADAATTIAATGSRGHRAAVSAALAPPASWTLAQQDDDGLLADQAALLSAHQAPVAAFGPLSIEDSWSENPSAPEPQALLSTTQQLQNRLLGRSQGESRPAPAPQALSDLRSWLAADDDLPRAS